MKRILLLICIAVLTTGVALAEPAAEGGKALSVRTFQFKYKDVDKAAAIIKPLLSAQGSLSMQPSERSLVVTDRPDNLQAIAGALAEFDSAPRPLKLSIRLVMASRVEAAPKVADDLADVAPKLAMLRYNSVESLGQADIESREGDTGTVELSNGYRAEFRLGEYDPASKTVNISDFKLSKLQDSQIKDLYKATLNVKIGQTLILAATRQGQRAVVVVLAARK